MKILKSNRIKNFYKNFFDRLQTLMSGSSRRFQSRSSTNKSRKNKLRKSSDEANERNITESSAQNKNSTNV